MIKKLLCATLLAAGATCAHAGETTYSFTYQGFVDAASGLFEPDMRLTGSFAGSDDNGDGILALSELTYFSSAGVTVIGPLDPDTGSSGGCLNGTGTSSPCEVDYFSYKLTGQLSYSVERSGSDSPSRNWYSDVVIGSHFRDGAEDYMSDELWEVRYNWSDQTTFTISPAPVPEPSAIVLLSAGFTVLALARRRKKASP